MKLSPIRLSMLLFLLVIVCCSLPIYAAKEGPEVGADLKQIQDHIRSMPLEHRLGISAFTLSYSSRQRTMAFDDYIGHACELIMNELSEQWEKTGHATAGKALVQIKMNGDKLDGVTVVRSTFDNTFDAMIRLRFLNCEICCLSQQQVGLPSNQLFITLTTM